MRVDGESEEKIKALVAALDAAMVTFRRDEPDRRWPADLRLEAGAVVADAAEELILALPASLWPANWFTEPGAERQKRSADASDAPTVDDLVRLLGL
ncbi:hypothetical protein ACIBCB_18245 [Streptomyces uncialis]|uniref:hypothetical protein n=1 Tax=Streptomyces uncialis TaxID=1048205 RepID=UPI003789A149